MARCSRPAFAQLCSMVVKHRDQRNSNYGDSAAMTVSWSVRSVASKTETKHHQLHYCWNVSRRTLHRSFAVGNVKQATFCVKSITSFPLPGTRKKGRPRKTWSECVKTDVDKCGLASVDSLDRVAWTVGWRNGWRVILYSRISRVVCV